MFIAGLSACGDAEPPRTGAAERALLEDVSLPPEDVSLLVLGADADWRVVADTVESVGGVVFHALPPRLVVARVPAGADAVLADAGLIVRFDGPVPADRLGDATPAELRFARVFGNRYYAPSLPRTLRIAHTVLAPPPGTAFEAAPTTAAELEARGVIPAGVDLEAERNVFVPYAAGTVVIAVWLPESNGVAEPSTEDWTEATILEIYDKIQAAAEAIARHEPAAKLRFVLHYESAPAPGGLPGTLDSDYEFGKHADFGQYGEEARVTAAMMSKLLGREITQPELWSAQRDYLNDLRDRYDADGAFIVTVAPNANETANLRAHASFNGPSTTLPSTNGTDVFMHEFGHIFGAYDEYCPDACVPPSALQGYLGIVNANATYREGAIGGIDEGRGENQPSLMMANVVNAVNGYTRGAWGWLDGDGDGLVDVLDTAPTLALDALVEAAGDGYALRVVGTATDVPAMPLYRTPFSVARVVSLQYRFSDVVGAPWLGVELPGDTRGRQAIDAVLGELPAGAHAIELRAVNSVGNVGPVTRLTVDAPRAAGSAAPYARLRAEPAVGSTETAFAVTVDALDLDGDAVSARLDVDGDGRFETRLSPGAPATVRIARPGRRELVAEVIDASGAATYARAELLVLDRNAPPRVDMTAVVSPQHGRLASAVAFDLAELSDPEGGPVELNWITEIADGRLADRKETGFSRDNTRFEARLETPVDLATTPVNLDAGLELPGGVQDVALLDRDTVAIARGAQGVLIVDISNREAPRALAELTLDAVARHLRVEGDTLYVLGGGTMAIVDVSDRTAPRERTQLIPTTNHRRASLSDAQPIDERFETWASVQAPWEERIESVSVQVLVDHPNHAELTLELVPGKGLALAPIELPLSRAGRGRRDYRFDARSVPALAELAGRFAMESWSLRITDAVANDSRGQLLGLRIDFDTRHRAIEVLSGAAAVLGALGRYVVVAGEGLQVLDVARPYFARQVARVRAAGFAGGALVGDTAVVLSPAEREGEPEPPSGGAAPGRALRGLYAVDLYNPRWPRLVRVDTDEPLRRLTVVGDRLYAERGDDLGGRFAPVSLGGPTTVVGDARAFARGRGWRRGIYDGAISSAAFADGPTLWNLSGEGRLEQLDASDPAAMRVLASYERPRAWEMRWLGGDEVLFVTGWQSRVGHLRDLRSTVSRVYRVTVEARDAAGAIARDTRTVHLVPYDHAPTITSVEVVRGSDTRGRWELRVRVADPDQEGGWDPQQLVRGDLDGDGLYETGWQGAWGDELTFSTSYPQPGRYTASFEVRDGFWATASASYELEVVGYEPTACTDELDCGAGQVCRFADDSACGADGAPGVCDDPELLSCRDEPEAQVCGCDGRSYRTACDAHRSGTSVASEGACPERACGGAEGASCPESQFCQYELDQACGVAGEPGLCVERPAICLFRPIILPGGGVCGCDGVTYSDACNANRAGVAVESLEPCGSLPVDCRDTGCPDGGECQACRNGNVCLPPGSRC